MYQLAIWYHSLYRNYTPLRGNNSKHNMSNLVHLENLVYNTHSL